MDGVEIHNPYRLFGLTSAFNPETVRAFDLYAGAFSAKVRRPALVAARRREPRRAPTPRALRGSSALSLTDANVVLEGRLPGGRPWLVARHRAAHVLRPRREPDRRARTCRRSATCRPAPTGRSAPAGRLTFVGSPEPRGDRRALRGRPRRRAGHLRHEREERPRRADVQDDDRPARAVADDRVLLPQQRRPRRRRAVPRRRAPVERARRRGRLRDGRRPVLAPARRARPRAAAGGHGLGRPAPRRDGRRGCTACARRRRGRSWATATRTPRTARACRAAPGCRTSSTPPSTPSRVGAWVQDRWDPATPLSDRGRPAPRLERRQPGGDALAAPLAHVPDRRRHARARGRRPLHAEPGLREADPVRLLRRPQRQLRPLASLRAGRPTPSSASSATSAAG